MADELKQALKEKGLTFGTKNTLKKLKLGQVKNVLLASNCPVEIKEDVAHYAKLAGAKVIELDIPDSEIGMVCKKQFSISVISY